MVSTAGSTSSYWAGCSRPRPRPLGTRPRLGSRRPLPLLRTRCRPPRGSPRPWPSVVRTSAGCLGRVELVAAQGEPEREADQRAGDEHRHGKRPARFRRSIDRHGLVARVTKATISESWPSAHSASEASIALSGDEKRLRSTRRVPRQDAQRRRDGDGTVVTHQLRHPLSKCCRDLVSVDPTSTTPVPAPAKEPCRSRIA